MPHAADDQGNMDWLPACEVEPATYAMAIRTFKDQPELSPQVTRLTVLRMHATCPWLCVVHVHTLCEQAWGRASVPIATPAPSIFPCTAQEAFDKLRRNVTDAFKSYYAQHGLAAPANIIDMGCSTGEPAAFVGAAAAAPLARRGKSV